MKKILFFILIFIMFTLYGCSISNYDPSAPNLVSGQVPDGESYLEITENEFIATVEQPQSTFSLDTSTAGYANIRRIINQGATVPKNAVKIEEMVNYFNYDYSAPTGDDALAVSSEIMMCPWNQVNKMVSIGVKAKEITDLSSVKNNIVLLLDVSGSMSSPNKLPLMQSAFKLFVETLNDDDTISVVTYAGGDSILLEGAKGFEKMRVTNVIEDLNAGGSTAGSKGIETAYAIAKKYFIVDGNNRVILGTDGDFNVGISTLSGLKKFISQKRTEEKIYLSVLGFGYGNLKDDNLETLAKSGNGNYAYIDTITEARKVLVEEIGGTLNIVSKDTKIQVTFNPYYIKEYRLLGYENKLITREEFDDENTDAGEIGAGHVTTAVYEVVVNTDLTVESSLNDAWMEVIIRYKNPTNDENKEIIKLIDQTSEKENPSEDLLFISGVIEMGLLLRDSPHKASSSYANIISRISNLTSVNNNEYKKEFLELVKKLNKN